MSLNKAELIGNVGQEPTFREFDNGGAVCNVTIATTDKGFTTKDGSKIEDKTEWHNVVFHNALAKIVAKYVSKGDKIFCAGKLKTRQYQQDGQTKYVTEIHAECFEFMQGKSERNQQNQQTGNNSVYPFDDDEPF